MYQKIAAIAAGVVVEDIACLEAIYPGAVERAGEARSCDMATYG